MSAKRFPTPEVCPVCGEDVPRNARACPECGADEQTGWQEDLDESGALGIDPGEFDYEKFVSEEFGGPAPKRSTLHRFWWIVAVIVLLAWILVILL